MPNEQKCNHPTGYQRVLETEHYQIGIVRCNLCGEFIRAETKVKQEKQ
jgi:hypothetical protein